MVPRSYKKIRYKGYMLTVLMEEDNYYYVVSTGQVVPDGLLEDMTYPGAGEYPFGGNGLTTATNGRVQPEYHSGKDVYHPIPDGTKLRRVTSVGGKDKQYKEFVGGQWVDGMDP